MSTGAVFGIGYAVMGLATGVLFAHSLVRETGRRSEWLAVIVWPVWLLWPLCIGPLVASEVLRWGRGRHLDTTTESEG